MTKKALLVLAALLAATGAEGQETARAAAPREGTVVVRTTSGSVRVVGWNRAEVAATSDEEHDRVRVSSRDGETQVRPRLGHGDLEVRVPAGSRVEVMTQSGDVRVEGVSGAVTLQSMSGDFRVSGSPRMVSVEGISGGFRMEGTTGTLRVKTVSGDVSVPRARGFVELATVSGNLAVTSEGVRRATIRNVSGETVFRGSVPRDASLAFEGTSGETEIHLPARVSADFELSALGNGEIRSDFGPRPGRTGGDEGMQMLRFSHGGGGAQITARTMSGTIRLRKQ